MSDTTPAAAAPAMTRAVRIAAMRAFVAGRAAKESGVPLEGCPYDPDATAEDADDTQQVAAAAIERWNARYWIKGWTRASGRQ